MTFPAAHMRLGHIFPGLFAKWRQFHAALKYGGKGTADCCIQAQMFAGVCARDLRHGTGLTKIGAPFLTCCFQQATFFNIPAAEIITVKMRALSAGWGFHT